MGGKTAGVPAGIEVAQLAFGNSQKVAGRVFQSAVDTVVVDNKAAGIEMVAGCSRRVERPRKKRGETSHQTSDQRLAEIGSGSHIGSGLAESSLVEGKPAAGSFAEDTEGSPVASGGIGVAAKPAVDTHSSGRG